LTNRHSRRKTVFLPVSIPPPPIEISIRACRESFQVYLVLGIWIWGQGGRKLKKLNKVADE
jgi:hypothetical protein